MVQPLGVGLIGCGTVGGGVAVLLLQHAERLAARAGRPLVLRRVVVRDLSKPRAVSLPQELITTDLEAILNDPEIGVAVEVAGEVDWARRAVLDCLKSGKHIVTANKALLALHGAEVFDTARRCERIVAFEASVAGGIPIIAALTQVMAANQITAVRGILNSTCNFILTCMKDHSRSFASAVAEAQERGYSEADPTLDVNGLDSAYKLAILAQIAFGITAPPDAIDRQGIADLHEMDVRFAGELGYTIKLLAAAWRDGSHRDDAGKSSVVLRVSPCLLPSQTFLSQVRDGYNAVSVVGDMVGDTLYYGRGAGQMPTASAVVADLVDIAVGRAQRTFQTTRLWSGDDVSVRLASIQDASSRFYLRLMAANQPEVLAAASRVFARHGIGIASATQHEMPEDQKDGFAPVVVMTHSAPTASFRAAVAEISGLEGVAASPASYPVTDAVNPLNAWS